MNLAPSMRVFRHRAYLHYWIMRQLISGARQMVAVAIGWQVYDLARLTRSIEESAFLLGMVGLAQFVPVFALSLVGGQAADRLDRKMILIVANVLRLAAILGLFATTLIDPDTALYVIFGIAAILGVTNAFTPAASNALYPRLVPRDELPNAIAWNSLGFQAAAIAGPAIGGVLFIFGADVVYLTAAAMIVCALIAIGTATTPKQEKLVGAHGWSMVIEGLRYVRDNKIVLGAISLDLVVVFFGGAVALLPVFARDILQVGAEGLGALRAAPAIGASVVAFMLAVTPLTRNIGKWMFSAIAIYGVMMLVFGFSKLFWLSMVALAISGAADMISVYVRASLIQLATPDAMRGRVTSVSFIFVSASNELGEFESGVAARFLGPIGAVILGGSVALASAVLWARIFPALWRADKIEETPEIVIASTAQTPPRAG